jgi:hypothetical protein
MGGRAVSGLRYDGTFELRWLRPWQAVRYGGLDYCEIIHSDTEEVLGRIYVGECITERLAAMPEVAS